ncbi:MAG: ATP-grasp domain-containing protein [Candidatus Omnitrophica bacterium]|nr:ATP-grasp domain-containing protein [Candidatus Omnitrophota bacterium]
MPYTLALTYNQKPLPVPGTGLYPVPEMYPVPAMYDDAYSEFDSAHTVQQLAAAQRAAGHSVYLVEATPELLTWFRAHRVDLVFNIAEGVAGESRESRVPAILDFLGIPYVGSGVLALALALDKAKAKQLFQAAGVPTPAFQLIDRLATPLAPALRCPLIVKPNAEGSAKGIWMSSVVTTPAHALAQAQRLMNRYRQPALIEEFVEGTELTVGILGDTALPVLEIDFSTCEGSGERFYSWRMKEYQGNRALRLTPTFWCPARLPAPVAARAQAVALRAHAALGCRDFSRVDLRLAADGTPYVLEVNPLPGLDPEESNFPRMARAAGWGYPALIEHLVQLAAARLPAEQAGLPARPPSSILPSSTHRDMPAPAIAGGMAALWPLRGGR